MLIFGYLSDGKISMAEHSGCPVLEGSKWIATQWYRPLGSDANLKIEALKL